VGGFSVILGSCPEPRDFSLCAKSKVLEKEGRGYLATASPCFLTQISARVDSHQSSILCPGFQIGSAENAKLSKQIWTSSSKWKFDREAMGYGFVPFLSVNESLALDSNKIRGVSLACLLSFY